MIEKEKRKAALIGIATFLLLSGLILYFVQHMDENLWKTLADTSPFLLLALLLSGFLYDGLDALSYWAAFRSRIPGFRLRNGVDVTYLRIFGTTAFVIGGAVPLQSLYLHKKGMMVGSGVGMVTTLYTLQKASVLLYSTALLLFQWPWVSSVSPSLSFWLLLSYVVCAAIIAFLLLICTSRRLCRLVCNLIRKLPSKGKWTERKEKWIVNFHALYTETHNLLHDKRQFAAILVLDLLKLVALYSIPYMALRFMGFTGYTLIQAQTLTALMSLIANTIPNVAGLGSVEVAFLLVFYESLQDLTFPALVYYRCASYYFPFLISVLAVWRLQRRIRKQKLAEVSELEESE